MDGFMNVNVKFTSTQVSAVCVLSLGSPWHAWQAAGSARSQLSRDCGVGAQAAPSSTGGGMKSGKLMMLQALADPKWMYLKL